MLSEEQVEIISDAIRPLFQYLENEIIKDVAKRIEKAEKYTRTVEVKIEAMKRLGYSPAKIRAKVMKLLMEDEGFQQLIQENTVAYKKECKKLMEKAQKSTDALVKELAQSAANMSFSDDVTIWEEHGKKLQDDSYLKELVEAICEQTNGEMKNLTNTRAVGFHTKSGLKKLPDVYRNELDKALIKICTGTYSSTEVVNETIHNLAESGLRSIDYNRGRSMQIDTAAKVAVRTAVNQIQANVQNENIRRTGENLVYVSSHWGARDKGEGVENHAKWQGKVYFIHPDKEYAEEAERIDQDAIEDIWQCTGYSPDGSRTNNPLGLHGYNCRHQHRVWFEGISSKPEEPLEPGPYAIDGKTYTYYEMTQKMRQMERKVRAFRREREALKALDQPVDILNASISEKTREYTEFCEKYNLKPRTENLRVEPNSSDVKKTKAWKEYEGLAKQEQRSKREDLTEAEYGAIIKYVSPDSYVLNDKLRREADSVLTDLELEWIKNINAALGKLPKYKGNLNRSIQFGYEEDAIAFYNSLEKGSYYIPKQFLSTTMDECYNDDAQVQMYIADAKKGSVLGKLGIENEVLYPINSRFVVVEKVEHDGKYWILMEEE